jgi:transmembrane sensor
MEQFISITALLQRYTEDQLTELEESYLTELMQDPEKAEAIKKALSDLIASRPAMNAISLNNTKRIDAILAIDRSAEPAAITVHRVHFLRKWGWVAAACVIALGLGFYYLIIQSDKSQKSTQIAVQKTQDIAPGSNKAIWTLADGKKIELDSTVLDMTSINEQPASIGYNELSTPRGGQYQLILPDGSKALLNAASTITYPVVFDGEERRVDIKGEVYFEVAKDAKKPFKVYGGGQKIEVLGTSFNVNIYHDEPTPKVSLIAGSIKVNNKLLKPGQAFTKNGIVAANLEQDLAWKDGAFNFDNLNLQEAMRQLERWYNIEVVYKNGIPDIPFSGKISRNLSLDELLKTLAGTDLQFTIADDRKIIITK